MSLSEAFRRFRKSVKITQKQAAEVAGVAERVYQSYEYGKVIPAATVLIAIADYFDVLWIISAVGQMTLRVDDGRRRKPYLLRRCFTRYIPTPSASPISLSDAPFSKRFCSCFACFVA